MEDYSKIKKSVSAVVVTYNRKDLLRKCLNDIIGQSFPPNKIFIVDNASTDGTQEMLKEEGFAEETIDDVAIRNVKLPRNIGGAGGFYTGMKLAHEEGCDAVWMMDDDGLPDKDCLKNLVPFLDKYDYLSPMVIDINNEKMMSFEGCTIADFLKRAKDGVVEGCANPFNGTLYSKRLIDAVGYPKKEMFIWGDEINYDLRAKAAGFQPAMVVSAIHRHPLNRQRYVPYLGKHKMVVTAEDWKLFCFLRNQAYNMKKYFGNVKCAKMIVKKFLQFGCYFTLQEFNPRRLFLIAKAFNKGLNEDFTGLEKYLTQK